MKYIVTMEIKGRYQKIIEADDINDVREIMDAEFVEADFGELKDIEGYKVVAEDESGECHELLY